MDDEYKALLEFLGSELSVVADFLGLLKEEEVVLNQGEPDLLEALIARKQLAVLQLQQLEAQREALFLKAGLHTKDDDPSSLAFSDCGDWAEDLAFVWKSLQDLVLSIRSQHELNGQLIAAYQQKNSVALSILLQGVGQGDLNLYNKIGTASPFSSRRLVDSA
ncbi:flagellar protein FlgN [Dechloromonas sp. ZY10]|uniref:flagella synthesis protein FlgN n=1 Tax=Dechloromonas aquae TaxID=2664436 RepID=UPI0035271D82